MSWWQRDIIEPGKLPLLVCFAAFVITFLTTRGITRAIRAGRGPFHNISEGGTHVHHAVPGIILLITGAFLAVDSTPHTATAAVAAAAVGIGTSLVSIRVGADAATATALTLTLALIIVCVLKGKFKLALFGIFVPPLAWIGAVRLARPESRWAKWRYGPRREDRAAQRAAEFDKRWDPILDRLSNLIAGKPSSADPAPK